MSSRKAVNKILASSLLLSGLLAWGFAGYFAVRPNKEKPNIEKTFLTAQDAQKLSQCEQTARTLRFEVFPYIGKNAVRFFAALDNNQLAMLADSSVLQASCELPLQYYCIGTSQCYSPGVTLIFGKDPVPHTAQPIQAHLPVNPSALNRSTAPGKPGVPAASPSGRARPSQSRGPAPQSPSPSVGPVVHR